jgi:DNA-binding response OmpR family regulator
MSADRIATNDTAKRTVLVVEDDASIMLGLRINLEAEGYIVLPAEDGEKGLELARSGRPDLVILDVMLPRMNGFQVLQTLRREGMAMPIIAKPFSLAELLARVRAALRRGPRIVEAPRTLHEFGEVRVDAAARTVSRAGAAVDMTATEFDLLLCLIEARGVALGRDAIFSRVWGPNHHGTPRTIDNFVQQLRAKLERDPQRPRHVVTVRGVGYRFDG